VTTVNLAGSLPARLSSLILEQSKTDQATGTVAVPEARARGLATFRNLTTALVRIPVGMVIRTQSDPTVRFATTRDAVVAAGIGKTVDVPIQAIEAGITGNLPAGALVSFEGELGTSLAVTNPDPTTDGTDKSAPIQTAADRSHLRSAMLVDILGQCGTKIRQTLSDGDVYFPDTLDVSQVLSETYFPAEDQSGDTLSLTMRVQCQAQYAGQTDLSALSKMSLDALLSEGYAPISDPLGGLGCRSYRFGSRFPLAIDENPCSRPGFQTHRTCHQRSNWYNFQPPGGSQSRCPSCGRCGSRGNCENQ
jgi:hypothetical protein